MRVSVFPGPVRLVVVCWLIFLVFSLLPRGQAAPLPALPPLRVRPVAPDVFVPTMHYRVPGSAATLVANGLLVQTSKGLMLIDGAWSADQTAQLLRWAADSLHQRVRLVVLTQAGTATPEALEVLRQHNARIYSSRPTARRWHSTYPRSAPPTAALKPYTLIRAGRTRLELFFPGAGFASDNVVAWLPRRKMLYGGELVREQAATSLGSFETATLKQWPASLRTLATRYRRARVVVPAHGSIGNLALLVHTQKLVREAARRKPTTALGHRP
ncbi:MBL fold metallo-hydrolase [Hymenobacter metallilatus]|uniref:Metallo-beta-lactamase domain-containing protein n=1 Tax=Hymenobacter metallilatus TaxID=2493666 RepID=A0A3R9N2B1_9BACT|nr:hypothetical protein [Hymenobacter metallilatus]RSK37298.1 hypothetical protein EI290_01185 [Hymenobacter metallilatus]